MSSSKPKDRELDPTWQDGPGPDRSSTEDPEYRAFRDFLFGQWTQSMRMQDQLEEAMGTVYTAESIVKRYREQGNDCLDGELGSGPTDDLLAHVAEAHRQLRAATRIVELWSHDVSRNISKAEAGEL